MESIHRAWRELTLENSDRIVFHYSDILQALSGDTTEEFPDAGPVHLNSQVVVLRIAAGNLCCCISHPEPDLHKQGRFRTRK